MTQHTIIRQVNHLLYDIKEVRAELNTGQLAEIRGKILEIVDLCYTPDEVPGSSVQFATSDAEVRDTHEDKESE